MILAADIGGTKTNVALFDPDPAAKRPTCRWRQSYPSAECPGLGAILRRFFEGSEFRVSSVTVCCVGVAGPILGGHCKIPNLPWEIDALELAATLGLPQVTLINDLEATAEGIATLPEEALVTLNAGQPSESLGTGAVIAAGTGLGMALLGVQAGEWIPLASEGGHVDYAPRNAGEWQVLEFLLQRFHRVSVERLVSGPGLVNLFQFFATQTTPDPGIASAVQSADPEAPALISQAALEERCPASQRALTQFIEAYGAAAGNLALMALATGGLFLGGGIAPKILPKLQEGAFMRAFMDKGRLSPALERVPVRVIMDQSAPLFGAMRRAQRELRA